MSDNRESDNDAPEEVAGAAASRAAKDAQTRERRACDQHRRELRVRRRRDVERLASAAPENDGGKAAAQDAQPSVGREDDEWSLSDGDIDEMRAGTWTRRSHGEPTPADEDFAAPPKRKRSKVQSELRKGPVVVRVLTEGSVGSAEASEKARGYLKARLQDRHRRSNRGIPAKGFGAAAKRADAHSYRRGLRN